MTAVANVRVNVQAPFPAMVVGSGPITLTKVNGVWTIGITGNLITTENPGLVATDFVLIWDSVAQGWAKISLPNLITQAQAVRLQRSVTASPIVVAGTDSILNVNIAGAAACTLPQASSRAGAPVTFKDVGAQFGLHPLTITAFAGDNIDGAGTLVLNVPRQGVTLVPGNDSVNTTTWSIE